MEWARVDEVGKAMFGRPIRLRLLLWVLAQPLEEAFFQGEAARGIEYSGQSEVAKELHAMDGLEMVRVFGRPSNSGRQNYCRIDSPFWGAIETVRDALVEAGAWAPGLPDRPAGAVG